MTENLSKIATAGNIGPKVRSDCFVSLQLTNYEGIKINLKSKVKVLFGDSIIELCKNVLNYFEVENAQLDIEDKGALPFVIAAR